jgi:hypothetical protein
MAQAKKKAQKAQNQAAALKARATPYVQQIMRDEDLRENITDAYASARRAYGRLSNGKSPTKQIFDDKKLQRNLREAAWSVKDASVALREGPKKKRRKGSRLGKLLLLAIVGSGIALAVSSGLRKKVLDALFGAEEEFEYTSTTATPTPPETTTPPAPSAN